MALTSRSNALLPVTGGEAAVDSPSRSRQLGSLLPGLVTVVVGVVVARTIGRLVPQVSSLLLATMVGLAMGNVMPQARLDALRPGLTFAAKKVLRVGVVLLGLRLSLGQVLELGAPMLAVVASTVTVTFFGTQWVGRRMGLSDNLSLLVATGSSICGASAIAAMEGVTDSEEDEVALSVGLVTLVGTVAMFTLPGLAAAFGLTDEQFGAWVGASIHDVGQVVAAGSAGSSAVLATAVVVKLTRVVLLAPLVAGVSLHRVRAGRVNAGLVGVERPAPTMMPAFVVGFLVMILVRTSGLMPAAGVDAARAVEALLLSGALVGLGSAVRFARLRRVGAKPILLSLAAWVVVASVSLVASLLLVS